MKTADQVAEWVALADAANEGPWRVLSPDSAYSAVIDADSNCIATSALLTVSDAAFIAAARTAVPALAAALESARTKVDELTEELASLRDAHGLVLQSHTFRTRQRDEAEAKLALVRLIAWDEGLDIVSPKLHAVIGLKPGEGQVQDRTEFIEGVAGLPPGRRKTIFKPEEGKVD